MPKRIILLNSSALKVSACKRRLHLVMLEGYRRKLNSLSIEFGSAFHLCPKITYQTGNVMDGSNAARKYLKDTPYEEDTKKKYLNDFMLGKVCFDWFNSELAPANDSFEVLRDAQGNALVEVKFAIPFYAGQNVEVIMCGTIDKVVVHRTSKLICEGDFKTTTSWDEVDYLRGWVLNTQRYFYNIALRKMIEESDSDSVLAAFKSKDVGSFIDAVFIKANGETNFKRSNVEVPTEKQRLEYELMLKQLCVWLDKHHEYYTTPPLPLPEGLLNDACSENKYGSRCDFFNACACNDSTAMEHVLRRNFIQHEYNPLDRQ